MARMTWDMVGDSRHRGLGPGGMSEGLVHGCLRRHPAHGHEPRARKGLSFMHDLVGVAQRGLASGSAAVLGRRWALERAWWVRPGTGAVPGHARLGARPSPAAAGRGKGMEAAPGDGRGPRAWGAWERGRPRPPRGEERAWRLRPRTGAVPGHGAPGSAAVPGRRRASNGHGGCARGRARSQGMRAWERGRPRPPLRRVSSSRVHRPSTTAWHRRRAAHLGVKV